MNKIEFPLNNLIEKYGIVEYIRDYYSAVNGYLHMLYTSDNFYIAEDLTYQPWLSIMGDIPENLSENKLYELLSEYILNDKYIAVYTNIEKVSSFLSTFKILTYHEDFLVACISKASSLDNSDIRLATVKDLPFIESTYTRSGHNQLLNRINAKQLWVCYTENEIKGYAGIHKDCSLGFEYVSPLFRRQNIATRLQNFVANEMLKSNMTPYVMISEGNIIGKNLQNKLNSDFAKNLFYFYAKGAYELE